MQKWKRRQRAKRYPLTHEVQGEMDEYERAVARKSKSGRLEKQRYPRVSEVFETSLTFWNSFNIHFVILLTLVVAHGRPSQKHLLRLLKVMHMCRYRFKGHEMYARHTLQIRTPIYSTLKLLTIT